MLSSLKSPSLPHLIAKTDSLSIHLIRKTKILTVTGETVLSKAELKHTDNSTEAVSCSSWVLQLGKNQRHISWKVDGLAEVKVKRAIQLTLEQTLV